MEPAPPEEPASPGSWVSSPRTATRTPPPDGWVAPPRPSGPDHVYLIGLAPLALFLFLVIAAPTFMSPMFDTSVPSGGIALGIPILVAAGILMIAGMAVMRAVPSCFGVAVGFLGFTASSLFLVIMGPAFCLVAQNLST